MSTVRNAVSAAEDDGGGGEELVRVLLLDDGREFVAADVGHRGLLRVPRDGSAGRELSG
jgi:hypothetical protein